MLKEFSWTNQQRHTIYAAEWRPAGEQVRAAVALVHGLGEHCRRYDAVAEYLNSRGLAVVGYDRQGFGRSGGRRGHATRYADYLSEIDELLDHTRERYPEVPIFLYGQSMGGQLTLHYLIERAPELAGAVVTAPHIDVGFQPNGFVVAAGKLLRRLRPRTTLNNQLDLTALSRSEGIADAYTADPHTHTRISAQIGIDLLERARVLQAYDGGMPVPTLLLHGEADRITSHSASRDFAERNAGAHFVSYSGHYHELHNEPGGNEILTYIADWMVARISAP